MKAKSLLMAVVVALICSLVAPAVAVAASPPHTEFSAVVVPQVVQIIEEAELGKSGRMLAEEYIGGFIPFSTWPALTYARVDITATTNYIQYPTGERDKNNFLWGRRLVFDESEGTR